MMRIACYLILCICGLAAPAYAEEAEPRTILALYDSSQSSPRFSPSHVFAEMPLNHIGLLVEYHDINTPPPAAGEMGHIRGLLLWLINRPKNLELREQWQQWLVQQVEAGKKVVMTGDGEYWLEPDANVLGRALGVYFSNDWFTAVDTTATQIAHKNSAMLDFERPVQGDVVAGIPVVGLRTGSTAHLTLRHKARRLSSNVVVTSSKGGYIANGFALYSNQEASPETRAWYINPFAFFAEAYQTAALPKPDITTMTGNRLYFSHIDGDGWNNRVYLSEYANKNVIAAEVILEKVVRAYPQLPVTMGLITADIDPQWMATQRSKSVAQAFMAENTVEPASHTHSHPFDWNFFNEYESADEKPFLPYYQGRVWGRQSDTFLQRIFASPEEKPTFHYAYNTPRAFAAEPFDLQQEIIGSIREVNAVSPKDKPARLIQWTGNTLPFERALSAATSMGILNINGGDTRFDMDYNSYAWVSPHGVMVGQQRQIYAAASNENTYTNGWTENFHAFRYLQETWENTESPLRVKPLNLYYHIYSAEHPASIRAILDNIEYVLQKSITAVNTTHYVEMANDFYTVRMTKMANNRWKVTNLGKVPTIRFDDSTQHVAMGQSSGVLGYKHYQGSVYVAMDPAADVWEIQLASEPVNDTYALANSSWPIRDLQRVDDGSITFSTGGYGAGVMAWRVPHSGTYNIAAGDTEITAMADNGMIQFQLPILAQPMTAEMTVRLVHRENP